jgi:4-deoxy-L-threo-5-hexosulose-uronate ketol-isomerase
MEVRYTPDPKTFSRMTSDELRKYFLIDSLFAPGTIKLTYCDVDRAIVGSAVPVEKPLKLESSKKEMAAEYFTERREVGVINIGDSGVIKVDGKIYSMNFKDAIYIGKGSKEIEFISDSPDSPASFYFVSFPAHANYPTSHVKFSEAEPARLGSQKDANKRTIYKFIHTNGVKSSQLVMGLTELEEGSVWNTMPVHTHQRRSEIYMYFNIEPSSLVFHLMGEPGETRHIVTRNRQAVISPSWSIHSGAATQNYSFIWAMGGENQAFDDMDAVSMDNIK